MKKKEDVKKIVPFPEDSASAANEKFTGSRLHSAILELIDSKHQGSPIGIKVSAGESLNDWYTLRHDCVMITLDTGDVILRESVFIKNFAVYCTPESFDKNECMVDKA